MSPSPSIMGGGHVFLFKKNLHSLFMTLKCRSAEHETNMKLDVVMIWYGITLSGQVRPEHSIHHGIRYGSDFITMQRSREMRV